ncbi:proline racemase family protein [Moraxella ovis]|uniref:proline racemase family protein n=1 Tax=Moraxella ovis TaxID=29433 RepID=UPI000D8CA39E|nr:proline racemase family protein [Moraxella ovis]SPX83135.1 4-hydroxyproline epimerase [Moraxella ovis]STZ06518.1 4-hydroxyproline epimerase [Moraxella ovis]
MSHQNFSLHLIDSHTGGEPTRMIYKGFPELIGQSVAEKLKDFKQNYDHLRRSIILEPRGSEVMVGALLVPPSDDSAVAGVIFFNNEGYLGMCGHGSIGVITSLAYQGKIGVGDHRLETPVGIVTATLHEDGSCSIRNVPSYRYRKQVVVNVPDLGIIHGDIAWGGNWFFLINDHGQDLQPSNIKQLTQVSLKIKSALKNQGITGDDGGEIDHIELFGKSNIADSKSFVLCPGGAYDRSPCGTGTSAKVACLAADNKLKPTTIWRQESIIGSVFLASYELGDDGYNQSESVTIIPTIRGSAYISAETKLVMQAHDPFRWGF